MSRFRGNFLIVGNLQVPTKGPSFLYVKPIKRALQIALMVEEKGEFAELPNGIMFERGHVAQRYAQNQFNAFDLLQITVEASDQTVVVNYKLGLANALRDVVLGLALVVSIFLMMPNLKGVLLAIFLGSVAYIVEFALIRWLELKARTWLERVAQAPAAVTMTVGEI